MYSQVEPVDKPSNPPASQTETGKKQCNCKNSQCIQLYCECFSNLLGCQDCNCVDCLNKPEHEIKRQQAILNIIEKNPNAFQGKLTNFNTQDTHFSQQKGCSCKKSNCLKKYCECYQAQKQCSVYCKCFDCYNGKQAFDSSEFQIQNNSLQFCNLLNLEKIIIENPSILENKKEQTTFDMGLEEIEDFCKDVLELIHGEGKMDQEKYNKYISNLHLRDQELSKDQLYQKLFCEEVSF